MKWTKDTKALWAKLALGGATIERRQDRKYRFVATKWYITLPLPSYLNGPFYNKSEAVLYGAKEMGLYEPTYDLCGCGLETKVRCAEIGCPKQ